MFKTNHKPATPLPWKARYGMTLGAVFGGKEEEVKLANKIERPDAAYLTHTANAYPKLIAFVRVVATQDKIATKQFMQDNANELLRELGEFE